MVEVAVDGRALELRQQVGHAVERVPDRSLAVFVQAGAVGQVVLRRYGIRVRVRTARISLRVDLEFARAVNDLVYAQAVAATDAGDDVPLSPERIGAVVPEFVCDVVRCTFRQTIPKIRVGPARVVLGVDGVALVMAREYADVGPPVIEAVSPFERYCLVVARQVIEVVVARPDGKTLEVVFQHRVDDARDRIRAVDRRCAVAQNLDAFHAEDGDVVRVHRVHRDEAAADFLGLVGGHVDEAPPVQQHERVARTHVAHVDGANVAARRVDAAGGVRFGKRILADLRDGIEKLIT